MDPRSRPRSIPAALAGAAVLSILALVAARPSLADDEDHAAAADDSARIEFHGYGEAHYNNPATGTMDKSAIAEADLHRLVLEWEYGFAPGIGLEAEVEYEHAAKELEIEEAFLDLALTPGVSLRVGSVPLPVGPFNESHQPASYYSVERPYLEESLIPTTWQEIGLGLVGRGAGGGVGYRAYLVTGLDASGFTSMGGLRDGRSGGGEAKAEDLAGVGRVEYATRTGLSLGASAYYGGADQSRSGLGRVAVAIGTADARYRRGGLDLRALAARVQIDGADRVSFVTGESVGKAMAGWSAEAAYDLLRRDARPSRSRALFAFARYERFDTNHEMARGFAANRAADRKVATAGVSFLPIDKIAFKTDFEHWEDGTKAELNRVNLGASFQF